MIYRSGPLQRLRNNNSSGSSSGSSNSNDNNNNEKPGLGPIRKKAQKHQSIGKEICLRVPLRNMRPLILVIDNKVSWTMYFFRDITTTEKSLWYFDSDRKTSPYIPPFSCTTEKLCGIDFQFEFINIKLVALYAHILFRSPPPLPSLLPSSSKAGKKRTTGDPSAVKVLAQGWPRWPRQRSPLFPFFSSRTINRLGQDEPLPICFFLIVPGHS